MTGVVLLLAAGSGVRLGLGTKAFVELAGVPLVRRAAAAAAAARRVSALVVAAPAGMTGEIRQALAGLDKPFTVVEGGATRCASARAALCAASGAEAVAVHDGARALCPPALFDACLDALDEFQAVVPAVAVSDTIKEVAGDTVVRTVDRLNLVAVQTPQAFNARLYRRAHRAGGEATDDAALVEALGVGVRVIAGDPANIKVTTPADLALAEAVLTRR